MKKRHLLRGLCAATLAVASLGIAQAQTYPTKPVRLIVPFPAGGATDLFARTLSQKISEKLGQPLVVENRPGAGGTLGSDLAAKVQPDGYTLQTALGQAQVVGFGDGKVQVQSLGRGPNHHRGRAGRWGLAGVGQKGEC